MKIALIAYNGNEIDIIIQRRHTEVFFCIFQLYQSHNQRVNNNRCSSFAT